jgi:hypothetical protein
MPDGMVRGAVLSSCGRYRYRLWRRWDKALPYTVFVGLNPSTADATRDDPTLRKAVGFARRWGCGGVGIVNLFAWRDTKPANLRAARARGEDIVGPDNDEHLVASAAGADVLVCAWGQHVPRGSTRPAEVIAMLRVPGATLECLGHNADGSPTHPLMLAYDTPRVPFEVRRD